MSHSFKENLRRSVGAIVGLCFLFNVPTYARAEGPPHRFTPAVDSSLPGDCGLAGEIAATRYFQQRNDRHVVVAAILDTPDETADSNFSELTVAEYVLTSHGCEERWRFEDETAGFQTSINFLGKSLGVEDLDDDGSLDTFFIYQFIADTDAHPIPSFLVIRVESQFLKASGTSRLNVGPDDVQGGDFKMSNELRHASQRLQDKARALWESYVE